MLHRFRSAPWLVVYLLGSLCVSSVVMAADDIYPQMASGMEASAKNVADQLVPYAFRLLGALFLIQFVLKNYRNAFHVDDAKQLLAKLVFPVLWVGFLLYLISDSYTILNAIFNSFMRLANIATGGVNLAPGDIMHNGIALQNNLVVKFNEATGANDGLIAAIKNFFPAIMLSVACLFILLAFFMVALAVAIAVLEFYFILAAAPIAYAMGGLDALKQSSIAPLQTMLSIGYRLIILGVIVGVLNGQLDGWTANFGQITADDWTPVWVVVFGAALGAVGAFSAGKIAGALASGQSNISGNEAMFAGLQMMQTIATTMTAAGAMANLAQNAAGAAANASTAAGQGVKRVADFMGGGSGSIANGAGGGSGTISSGGSADTAKELLGPVSGTPWTGSSDSGSAEPSEGGSEGGSPSSGGDATDAGISSPANADANTSNPSTKTGSADQRSLSSLDRAARTQEPSRTAAIGRSSMDAVRGLQHDSGHVQVHVDLHSRD